MNVCFFKSLCYINFYFIKYLQYANQELQIQDWGHSRKVSLSTVTNHSGEDSNNDPKISSRYTNRTKNCNLKVILIG